VSEKLSEIPGVSMPEFKNPLIFLWKTPPRDSGTPFFRWFFGSIRPGGAIAEVNANACYYRTPTSENFKIPHNSYRLPPAATMY
jgi:hypothetical protein